MDSCSEGGIIKRHAVAEIRWDFNDERERLDMGIKGADCWEVNGLLVYRETIN